MWATEDHQLYCTVVHFNNNLSMMVASGGIQMPVAVTGQVATDGVGLRQRDVVSLEMLL